MALKTVPFNVAFTFSRPNPADYEDINGETQTAGTDVPRFNYSEGVGEGLMLDASLSEIAAINDIPNFNSSSGTWVIKADLDKSIPIPGSGFGFVELMEGSGTLVFVYNNGVGKCWADGQVLLTVDPFSPAEPGFLSNGGLAKIQDLTYYPYAWTDEDAAAKSSGAFYTYPALDRLFLGGEQGAWYDPSDLTTLFRDSGGTIPVTADGDPVGLMLDKSGNGNHASQSVTGAKPIYRTDGTLHWLEFDGVNAHMVSGMILPTPVINSVAIYDFNQSSVAGASAYQGQGYLASAAGWGLGRTESGFIAQVRSASSVITVRSPFEANKTTVLTGSLLSNSASLRRDGEVVDTTPHNLGSVTPSTSFGLGARELSGSFDVFSKIKYYGGICVGKHIVEPQLSGIESYLAAKSGVTL